MTRRALTTLLLIVCVGLPAAYAQAQGGGAARATREPAEVVRGFYAWYLGRLNKDDWTPISRRREALKYLDARFHRRAPGIIEREGVDIFICAQDWRRQWEREFRVAPPRVRGSKATATVTLPGGDGFREDIRIRVSLRRAAGDWKIDAMECLLPFDESR